MRNSRESAPPPSTWVAMRPDRKSTRLNSSHSQISYAVFCLKKKKQPRADHIHRAYRLPTLGVHSEAVRGGETDGHRRVHRVCQLTVRVRRSAHNHVTGVLSV